jgi:hypothetical protein
MAVTFITGPMDKHPVDVNQKGAQTKSQKGRRNGPNAKGHPKTSNDYIARIVRSTHELSASIKYISYVIAYSAVGSSSEKKNKETGFSNASKRANSIKSQGSTMQKLGLFGSKGDSATPSPAQPQPRKRSPQPDPFGKGELLYPVTHDGRLRDVYVQMCIQKVNETNFLDGGWDRKYIHEWFGRNLERQITNGDAPRDFQAQLLAAVELHRRMSTHESVPHPKGITKDVDNLWRDVVDALNHGVKMAKPAIMHVTGNPNSTLEEFLEEWDRVVKEEKWNTMKLAMFQS